MTTPAFPRGIEVIVSALIVDARDRVLLVRQPKWGSVWTLPGGHLEPGETLSSGAHREGQEETGLELSLIGLVNWGELIQTTGRPRPIHFIFFDYAFSAAGTDLTLDSSEICEALWVELADLHRFEIANGYAETLAKFQDQRAAVTR